MPITHPDQPWLRAPALIYGIEIFAADARELTGMLEMMASALGATQSQIEGSSLDTLLPDLVPEWAGLRLSWSRSQSSGRWAFIADEAPCESTLESCVFGLELHEDIDRLPPSQARAAMRSKAPASLIRTWAEQIAPLLSELGIHERFAPTGPREIAIWDGDD